MSSRSSISAQLSSEQVEAVLRVLSRVEGLELAMLFGSLARGDARPSSDMDLALLADHPLSAQQRFDLVGELADQVQRPVDLIDLRTAGEPTLGQVARHGRRIFGTDRALCDFVYRQLVDQEDFMPLRTRMLEERRRAWIGK